MDAASAQLRKDGAFERFLAAAIAAILTIVFSWRLLNENDETIEKYERNIQKSQTPRLGDRKPDSMSIDSDSDLSDRGIVDYTNGVSNNLNFSNVDVSDDVHACDDTSGRVDISTYAEDNRDRLDEFDTRSDCFTNNSDLPIQLEIKNNSSCILSAPMRDIMTKDGRNTVIVSRATRGRVNTDCSYDNDDCPIDIPGQSSSLTCEDNTKSNTDRHYNENMSISTDRIYDNNLFDNIGNTSEIEALRDCFDRSETTNNINTSGLDYTASVNFISNTGYDLVNNTDVDYSNDTNIPVDCYEGVEEYSSTGLIHGDERVYSMSDTKYKTQDDHRSDSLSHSPAYSVFHSDLSSHCDKNILNRDENCGNYILALNNFASMGNENAFESDINVLSNGDYSHTNSIHEVSIASPLTPRDSFLPMTGIDKRESDRNIHTYQDEHSPAHDYYRDSSDITYEYGDVDFYDMGNPINIQYHEENESSIVEELSKISSHRLEDVNSLESDSSDSESDSDREYMYGFDDMRQEWLDSEDDVYYRTVLEPILEEESGDEDDELEEEANQDRHGVGLTSSKEVFSSMGEYMHNQIRYSSTRPVINALDLCTTTSSLNRFQSYDQVAPAYSASSCVSDEDDDDIRSESTQTSADTVIYNGVISDDSSSSGSPSHNKPGLVQSDFRLYGDRGCVYKTRSSSDSDIKKYMDRSNCNLAGEHDNFGFSEENNDSHKNSHKQYKFREDDDYYFLDRNSDEDQLNISSDSDEFILRHTKKIEMQNNDNATTLGSQDWKWTTSNDLFALSRDSINEDLDTRSDISTSSSSSYDDAKPSNAIEDAPRGFTIVKIQDRRTEYSERHYTIDRCDSADSAVDMEKSRSLDSSSSSTEEILNDLRTKYATDELDDKLPKKEIDERDWPSQNERAMTHTSISDLETSNDMPTAGIQSAANKLVSEKSISESTLGSPRDSMNDSAIGDDWQDPSDLHRKESGNSITNSDARLHVDRLFGSEKINIPVDTNTQIMVEDNSEAGVENRLFIDQRNSYSREDTAEDHTGNDEDTRCLVLKVTHWADQKAGQHGNSCAINKSDMENDIEILCYQEEASSDKATNDDVFNEDLVRLEPIGAESNYIVCTESHNTQPSPDIHYNSLIKPHSDHVIIECEKATRTDMQFHKEPTHTDKFIKEDMDQPVKCSTLYINEVPSTKNYVNNSDDDDTMEIFANETDEQCLPSEPEAKEITSYMEGVRKLANTNPWGGTRIVKLDLQKNEVMVDRNEHSTQYQDSSKYRETETKNTTSTLRMDSNNKHTSDTDYSESITRNIPSQLTHCLERQEDDTRDELHARNINKDREYKPPDPNSDDGEPFYKKYWGYGNSCDRDLSQDYHSDPVANLDSVYWRINSPGSSSVGKCRLNTRVHDATESSGIFADDACIYTHGNRVQGLSTEDLTIRVDDPRREATRKESRLNDISANQSSYSPRLIGDDGRDKRRSEVNAVTMEPEYLHSKTHGMQRVTPPDDGGECTRDTGGVSSLDKVPEMIGEHHVVTNDHNNVNIVDMNECKRRDLARRKIRELSGTLNQLEKNCGEIRQLRQERPFSWMGNERDDVNDFASPKNAPTTSIYARYSGRDFERHGLSDYKPPVVRRKIIAQRERFFSEEMLSTLNDSIDDQFANRATTLTSSLRAPCKSHKPFASLSSGFDHIVNIERLKHSDKFEIKNRPKLDEIHPNCILSRHHKSPLLSARTFSVDSLVKTRGCRRHSSMLETTDIDKADKYHHSKLFRETDGDVTFPLQTPPDCTVSMMDLSSGRTRFWAKRNKKDGSKSRSMLSLGHSTPSLETDIDEPFPSEEAGMVRVMSIHELRVAQSLQRLNVPDWYRNSSIPRCGSTSILRRDSNASSISQWSSKTYGPAATRQVASPNSSTCTLNTPSPVVIQTRTLPSTLSRAHAPISKNKENISPFDFRTVQLPSSKFRNKERPSKLMPIPILPFKELRAKFETSSVKSDTSLVKHTVLRPTPLVLNLTQDTIKKDTGILKHKHLTSSSTSPTQREVKFTDDVIRCSSPKSSMDHEEINTNDKHLGSKHDSDKYTRQEVLPPVQEEDVQFKVTCETASESSNAAVIANKSKTPLQNGSAKETVNSPTTVTPVLSPAPLKTSVPSKPLINNSFRGNIRSVARMFEKRVPSEQQTRHESARTDLPKVVVNSPPARPVPKPSSKLAGLIRRFRETTV